MDKKRKLILGGLAFVAAVGYYALEAYKAQKMQQVIDITEQNAEQIEPQKQ